MESSKYHFVGHRVHRSGYYQVGSRSIRVGRSKPQQDYYRNYHKPVRKFKFGKQFELKLPILRLFIIQQLFDDLCKSLGGVRDG